MRGLALVATMFALAIGGCGESAEQPTPVTISYGSLPGLRASTDKQLRDELVRIEEEGGTPKQLSETSIEDEENVAVGLVEIFFSSEEKTEKEAQREMEKMVDILRETERLFPNDFFQFNPLDLQNVIEFRKKHEQARLLAREALKRPKCSFGIDFAEGLGADTSFIQAVKIFVRLEAFRAEEALANDDLQTAIDSFNAMLQLTSLLAAEQHLVTRLEAAFLRTETFKVLLEIAANDEIDKEDLVAIKETVQKMLDDWPSDAEAWIGDRALGLHSYEMIRNGELPLLLQEHFPEMVEQFKKEGVLDYAAEAAKRTADADTRYYLSAMRRIIESCQRPYYERAAMIAAIDQELQEKRNTPEFPVVAGRLLLLEIGPSHAIQAQDRANWEAWANALSLAVGELPKYEINPLTGRPYRHENQNGMIRVWEFGSGGDDNPEIKVPVK